MASNSAWSKSVPSGLSRIADGDDAIRSFKSHMQAWWEDEHYATGGSTNSAGKHRVGSARIYQGTTSQLSNPTGDGSHRLMHTTDDGGLWVSNPSTSSWTLLTNSITLGSQQTWTALQEFTSDVSASDVAVGGAFVGVVSGSTTIATALGVAADSGLQFSLVNVGSALTKSDPIIIGWEDTNADLLGSAQVNSSTGSISFNFKNRNSVSRTTVPAGSVVYYIGFRRS